MLLSWCLLSFLSRKRKRKEREKGRKKEEEEERRKTEKRKEKKGIIVTMCPMIMIIITKIMYLAPNCKCSMLDI